MVSFYDHEYSKNNVAIKYLTVLLFIKQCPLFDRFLPFSVEILLFEVFAFVQTVLNPST